MAPDPSLYQALGNMPGGSPTPAAQQPSAPVAPPPGGPAPGSPLFAALQGAIGTNRFNDSEIKSLSPDGGSSYKALGALPTSAPIQPQNLQLGPQVADASTGDLARQAKSFFERAAGHNAASANADVPHKPTSDEIRAKNAKNFGR